MNLVGKHMDVVAPLGWNWTLDDWCIYNFVRDLCSCGGVLSGGLYDWAVLIQYDKHRPSKSLIIKERITPDWWLQEPAAPVPVVGDVFRPVAA